MIARFVVPSLFASLLLGAACSGPPAPDAVVCQDFIHRLCLAPRCPRVDQALSTGDACETDLLARTGCGADGFTFSAPSRQTFLQCRVALLRAGGASEQHPRCSDVDEVFDLCDPQVVAFLRTGVH